MSAGFDPVPRQAAICVEATTEHPKLSVVIPAYNESARLPPTLDRLITYFHEHGPSEVEILVVDDGSRDDTPDLVAQYAAQHHEIRLLRNAGNRGKGYAVRHGMLKAKGEWILFTDADLSAPIEELPILTAAAERNNAAIAFGSRALDPSKVEVSQSFARELAGRVFNLVLRGLVGLPYRDTQCGFKLFRRDAARELFAFQRLNGFSFDVEDLVIAKRLELRAVEVPVKWRNVEGTKVSLLNGVRSFADLARIRFNDMRGCYRREGRCAGAQHSGSAPSMTSGETDV
jgi:glycosyltransferase involved in cell wall biosynthesis